MSGIAAGPSYIDKQSDRVFTLSARTERLLALSFVQTVQRRLTLVVAEFSDITVRQLGVRGPWFTWA